LKKGSEEGCAYEGGNKKGIPVEPSDDDWRRKKKNNAKKRRKRANDFVAWRFRKATPGSIFRLV